MVRGLLVLRVSTMNIEDHNKKEAAVNPPKCAHNSHFGKECHDCTIDDLRARLSAAVKYVQFGKAWIPPLALSSEGLKQLDELKEFLARETK